MKSRSLILKFHNLISEAQLALEKGEEARTVRALRQAFALAREEGYCNLYFWRNSVMARLCSKALDNGIEEEYVRALIKKRSIVPDGLEVISEKWPWPLKIYTLGRFSLVIDDKAVGFSGKGQKKPIEMLKTLITLGGREISEEAISDILWPDSDGDKAHQSFNTTLRRLRKLVGSHKAVKLNDRRLTLDPRHSWVDVWAFERAVSKAETLLGNGETYKALPLTNKTVKIYCGDFLSQDSTAPSIISKRERLRSRFLESLDKLGEALEDSGDLRKAINFYKRALDVDDLAEDFYRRLMLCHLGLGQKSSALTVYRRLKRTLSIKLGIEPSAATVAVYKNIIS